jgi:hypothetical protein
VKCLLSTEKERGIKVLQMGSGSQDFMLLLTTEQTG